jgi:hypothetical protein
MRTIENEERKVTFNDNQKTKDALFEKVVAFFEEHECFCGESCQQCDDPQIHAPELLADICDDILEFKTEWKD